MFQRLYELSTILPQNLATWEKLNEGMPPQYNQGFALCFDEQGNWFGVETLPKTGKDVVYRAGSPRGTDLTPCCKLSPTTARRLLQSIKALADYSESDWLRVSIKSYEENEEIILKSLEKETDSFDKDSRNFVFWAKLLDNGQIDPVYTWNIAKEFLEQQFSTSLSKKGGQRGNGTCIISGKINQEVYGGFSDIACYNLDKSGSIAGGFTENLAHRNFPVCKESAVDIAYAFTYAQTHLQGAMAGETYLILPYAINPEVREQLHDHLRQYPERFQLGKTKDLVAEESELIDEFGNLGDQIAFFLVFYEENQASWRIQAEIQELLPSRLHQLKESREKIAKSADLIYEKEGEEKTVNISAKTFRNFTGKPIASKKEIKNTLRNWLIALFEGKTIDYRHFLRHLVDKLVATGKGKETQKYLHHTTREAWGLYRYALSTGLITILRKTTMDLPVFNSVYGRYIHEHSDFFAKPEIVTTFLSGCYVSVTANVQKKKRSLESREKASIVKKFLGKLLSKKDLIELHKKAFDKLAYYDELKYHATGLDSDLNQAWIACGQSWNISNEETTFAFTIGYSLQYRISQLYKESPTDTTEE